MPDAFLVDYIRTPIGRYGGALSQVRPDDLASQVIRDVVERVGVAPENYEDVYFGAANQAGEDRINWRHHAQSADPL
jgi:acetyl-CoA acetyltransferase